MWVSISATADIVHAERKAGRVIITDLNQPWYVKHFLGARRVVDREE